MVRGVTRCVFVDRARIRVLGGYELEMAVELLREHMKHGHPLETGSTTYWWLGRAYEELHDLAAAEEAFLLSLQINPDLREAQAALRRVRASQ